MGNHTRIVIFDELDYPKEKQAEGLAVSEAIVTGKCNECAFLKKCESDSNFQFPVFAWCYQRKLEILKEWEKNGL